MDNQFGRDQNRKSYQKPHMHFNVAQEGKPTCTPDRVAKGGQ